MTQEQPTLKIIIIKQEEYLVEGIILNGREDYENTRNYWFAFRARWDGCIDYYEANNVPFSKEYGLHNQIRDVYYCDQNIHICSIRNHIEGMELIRETMQNLKFIQS